MNHSRVVQLTTELSLSTDLLAFELEQKKLAAVFRESPAAMALWRGPELIFELVNPRFQAIFPGRELSGRALEDAIPEFKGQPFATLLRRVLETGEPYVGKEMLARIPDPASGELEDRYYDFTYVQIIDLKGHPYGVYDHAIDVTERVLARQSLEASEWRFRELAENSPQIIWTVDAVGKLIYLNQQWPRFAGYTFEETRRVGLALLIHPDDLPRVKANFATGISLGRGFEDTFRLRRADGEYRWFAVRGRPLCGEFGQVVQWTGFASDVHDQRQGAEYEHAELVEAESLNRALKKERELRERFVASLTHDLRTPLSAVKLMAQLLLRVPSDADAVRRTVGKIGASIDRAERMIRNLLDVNRIEAGVGLPLNIGQCDLQYVVAQAVEHLVEVYGATIRVVSNGLPILGQWDAESLERVVENLGSNAIKYGARNSVVSVLLDRGPSSVRIAVHNEGVPIPPKELSALFTAYHRSDSAVASGHKGWGIGLTLVQGIVEAHQGRMSVQSQAGAGTTFTVDLPLVS